MFWVWAFILAMEGAFFAMVYVSNPGDPMTIDFMAGKSTSLGLAIMFGLGSIITTIIAAVDHCTRRTLEHKNSQKISEVRCGSASIIPFLALILFIGILVTASLYQ